MPYVFSFVVYIYDLMYRSLHVLCPFIPSLHVRFNVPFRCTPALSAPCLRSAAHSPELDVDCGATRSHMLGRPVAKHSGVCGKVHARCRGMRRTCRRYPPAFPAARSDVIHGLHTIEVRITFVRMSFPGFGRPEGRSF